MDTEVNTGMKSYPLPLAQAMEQLVRDVARYEYRNGVGALTNLQDRAFDVVETLNKWR